MTLPETAARALLTLTSIAGLLWLMYWGFQSYRIDKFRFQLFSLRAELFDLGLGGDISFDHAAYSELRNTLNGFLRFADRLSLLSYFLITRDLRRMIQAGEVVVVKVDANPLHSDLQPGVIAQLRDIRSRMHVAVFEQIIFSSPAFVLTSIPFLLAMLIRFVGHRFVWSAFKGIYRSIEAWFERAVRPLDAFAQNLGTA
jgi:hypothetical protein